MADVINGQLLTDELKPVGPPIQAAAHDFYLYPGALTANPANGDYLAMQLSDSHKLTAAHDVYLTRIGSDGSVAGTASWQAGTQARAGQVHATYQPRNRNYLVAWLISGGGSTVFAARTASADLSRLGPIRAIVPGSPTLGSDFSVAEPSGTASAVIVWLGQTPGGARTLVAQHLSSAAQPVGSVSTISALADPSELANDGLGRLQLVAAGDHAVAWWQGLDQSEVVSIPPRLNGGRPSTNVDLPGARSTYSHATVVNPNAGTLAVLSSGDSRAANQIYARVVGLPH